MAVLELAGEQRPRRRERLETLPVVAEPDDDRARVEVPEGLEQDVHSLVLDQLPEVDDRRPLLGEEAREPLGVALVRLPLLAVAGIRRIRPRLVEESRQRVRAGLGPELLDVHARRHDLDAVDVPRQLLEHVADVLGARVDDLRAGERLRSPAREIGPSAHRVLELGAVRLDPEGHPARRADRRSEQDMVREDEVGRSELPQGRRVRRDVRLPLRRREVDEQARLEPLVAVEDEGRQQPLRQLRHDERRAAEVVALRMPLLADDRDLVPRQAPLPREGARVDVGACSSEEVPVPEKDSQVRWKYSA